jgi:hypothetical protein
VILGLVGGLLIVSCCGGTGLLLSVNKRGDAAAKTNTTPFGRPSAPPPPAFSDPAMSRRGQEAAEAATGIVVLGFGLIFWGLLCSLFIAYWVLVILLLAWVARDARARSVDGGAVWVLVILLTGPIGFLVYLASRPQGMLVACSRCGNKRLQAATFCPHCGHAVAA